jgi:hypothetical protein
MAGRIDRAIWRAILEAAAAAHPGPVEGRHLAHIADEQTVAANALYLIDHGLATGRHSTTINDRQTSLVWVRITGSGADYLSLDGGLTAELGTITVRFDDAQLREMLVALTERADGTQQDKASLITALRTLPATALQSATQHLVVQALQAAAPGLTELRKWLGLP